MKSANRIALKEWSVVIRFLHEGGGILTFVDDYVPADREFFLFPTYDRQRSDALKPSAGMVYQHELRPPKTGDVYLRDYAEVVASFEIQSASAAMTVQKEHPFVELEMRKRLEIASSGLVALALRVYRLAVPRRIVERQKYEEGERFLSLPEEIPIGEALPVLTASELERRLAAVRRALGGRDAA
jgi:hypothetical protein